MKKLNIFVDESGDLGNFNGVTNYYIITFVFHNQEDKLDQHLDRLNFSLEKFGMNNFAVHTEPLIRREESFFNLQPNERRYILTRLYFFACNSPISYKTFVFSKKELKDSYKLQGKISIELNSFLCENSAFFKTFDKVTVFYDNGQHSLLNIINSVFSINIGNFEIKEVLPVEYRLFQVADMICSLCLTNSKMHTIGLSKSEKYIFHSKSDFVKDFIKPILKKRFRN